MEYIQKEKLMSYQCSTDKQQKTSLKKYKKLKQLNPPGKSNYFKNKKQNPQQILSIESKSILRPMAKSISLIQTRSSVDKFKREIDMLKEVKKQLSQQGYSRIKTMKKVKNKNKQINLQMSKSNYSDLMLLDLEKGSLKIQSNIKTKADETAQIKENKIIEKPKQFLKNVVEDNKQHVAKQKNQQPQLTSLNINNLYIQSSLNPQQVIVQKSQRNSINSIKQEKSEKQSVHLQSKFHKTKQKDMKQRYQERLWAAKQKIANNKIKLLQSQTKFKLQKKIKENIELSTKKQMLNEIIVKRMQDERQKQQKKQKQKAQQRFIHQNKMMKVHIQRRIKKLTAIEQRQLAKSKSEESLLNMTFNNYLKAKSQVQKQALINYRISFMKDYKSNNLSSEKSEIEKQNQTLKTKNNHSMSMSRISRIRSSKSVRSLKHREQ